MAGFENSSVSPVDLQTNVTSESTFQGGLLEIFATSSNLIFGPLIHGCVLWLIVKGKRIASEFLLLNLSVCEVIISMTYLLYLLEMKFPQLYAEWRFSAGLLTTARPLFQSLICFERYLAVVHPVTFLKYKPLRYKAICSTVTWIICLGSCVFTMIAHEKLYIYFLLFQFILYFFINLFCCVAVLRALNKSGPGERGRERKKKEENHRKEKAFKHISIITIFVLFLYIPIIITQCLFGFSKQDVSYFSSFSFLCLILAGFVPPGLYLYRHGKLSFCSNCSFKIQK